MSMWKRHHPRGISTVLAGHRFAVRTVVALLAVPLAPVTALLTVLAVPGTAVLHQRVPAEGVPVGGAALSTAMLSDELLERYSLVITRQSVLSLQLLGCKTFDDVDILNSAKGEALNVDVVQWILAIDAPAGLVARLVVFQTAAAIRIAASGAVAVVLFLHQMFSHFR